ncbi:EVE domain-containing protein [Cellvibrio mixtus]|uniref:EVE domain-containing protein n=1 Tax=Cellvibrio mixtus TaxID=39650 RepID=UPI0005873F91|nr:EVE domain-containing protein [Cellvibrio mixtus]
MKAEPHIYGIDHLVAPNNPRWVSVDIQLTKVFPRLISLAEIKAQTELENMVLVKQSRLSTQPVTGDEWRFINKLMVTPKFEDRVRSQYCDFEVTRQ